MNESILKVDGVMKTFDGLTALDGFSCDVRAGEVLGLIGPNGAGKTTLFNVVTGFIGADRGKVALRGKDVLGLAPHRVARAGVTRTFQKLRLIRKISVLDNVMLAFKDQLGESLFNVFLRWRTCRKQEAENRAKAMELLEFAGLREKAEDRAEALSYGQQKLVSLVCCLAAEADLLLLDEPVAGIQPAMIEKILGIIRELPQQGKSVVLIEHNLDAVMQVCDRVVFMDAGRKVSEGTPEEVRSDPKVIEAYIA